jgi:hypothetical protein
MFPPFDYYYLLKKQNIYDHSIYEYYVECTNRPPINMDDLYFTDINSLQEYIIKLYTPTDVINLVAVFVFATYESDNQYRLDSENITVINSKKTHLGPNAGMYNSSVLYVYPDDIVPLDKIAPKHRLYQHMECDGFNDIDECVVNMIQRVNHITSDFDKKPYSYICQILGYPPTIKIFEETYDKHIDILII